MVLTTVGGTARSGDLPDPLQGVKPQLVAVIADFFHQSWSRSALPEWENQLGSNFLTDLFLDWKWFDRESVINVQ